MATEDSKLPVKIRVQQIEILDMYKLCAADDPTVKPWLVNVAKKLNKVLKELEVKDEKE